MNIALYGGTFDPIHRGHLAVARAAAKKFKLSRIYFVPSDIPPHKRQKRVTPYRHRYAMVRLATAGERRFKPSRLEAPRGGDHVHYSVDTVARMKKRLKKSDRLFFLIGMDAFRDIATWRQPEKLLRACEFIVVSRPGSSLRGSQPMPGVTIHLLQGVHVPVSATTIRRAARSGRGLGRLVPPAVAAYIRKHHLYEVE